MNIDNFKKVNWKRVILNWFILASVITGLIIWGLYN